MNYHIEPAAIESGVVVVPGDKSISHRALMLGAIANGVTTVSGMLMGDDCLATADALRAMGVQIDVSDGDGGVRIHGRGLTGLTEPAGSLDMGNSGTAMRLFTGLLAGQAFATTLTGDDSLSQRPMERVAEPLRRMGAVIDTNDGLPPLNIQGSALCGIRFAMPVASAQLKSALLLAGLYAKGETIVVEPAATRDHTERMLRAMGVAVSDGGSQIAVQGGQSLQATHIDVPADISSAAFILLAAVLSPDAEVKVPGVGVNTTRTGVIQILRDMGADIEVSNPRLDGEEPVADVTARASTLQGIDVDPALVPLAIDEFPMLFVAAACARGSTRFTGIEELRVKESDRIAAMAAGLRVMGIDVDESDDSATVHGGELGGGTIDSVGDHRVAMSFAIAATVAAGPTTIENTAAVATSFPGFLDCLRQLGIDAEDVDDVVPVVCIDGPSGSGKGTIARNVATVLGFQLLDSGALYRLTALAAVDRHIPDDDEERLAELAATLDVKFQSDDEGNAAIYLDGNPVGDRLRTEECGRLASVVAAIPAVREALFELQLGFRQAPGLVADGRDMGSTVFPDARLKVYLTASAEERGKRRYKQLKDKGIDVSLAALSRDIEERDRRDTERAVAPLRPAEDARLLDSSELSIDEVTDTVLAWAAESGIVAKTRG